MTEAFHWSEVQYELLKVKVQGLEAALQISRDSERQTKERLSSVSDQLLDANAEIRRLNDQLTDLLVEKEKVSGQSLERIQLGPQGNG